MIVELRDYICFETRHAVLRAIPKDEEKVNINNNFRSRVDKLRAASSSYTCPVGFNVTIRTSFVAIARVWKFLPKLGANAMSCTASVIPDRVSAFIQRLLLSEYS